MRPANQAELDRWDDLVTSNPDGGNVLQLKAFGETKARHGWTPKYLMMGEIAILVLSRQIPPLGEYWYVPKGPGVTDIKDLKSFAAQIPGPKPFAVRIDPEIGLGQIQSAQMRKLGFVPAPRDIQYNVSTVIVDLSKSEEELLDSFKQKTRYNIRLATKKGVTVEAVPTDQNAIDTMYHLTEVMTSRAGVYLRDKQYFADFWRLHSERGHGQMFFAKYENQILAGAYVTYVGTKALYKDGGSLRENQSVQAPYALQWEVMRWLKNQGIKEYDMHGVPPLNHIDDSSHPLAGLARFKTGFQSEVTEFIGTYDLPLDSTKYQVWQRIGERLASTYEYRVKKRLFY